MQGNYDPWSGNGPFPEPAKLVEVKLPDGSYRYVTEAEAVELLRAPPAPAPMGAQPAPMPQSWDATPPTTPGEFTLSPDQEVAIQDILVGLLGKGFDDLDAPPMVKRKAVLVLTGPAGAGKSTIVRHVAETLREYSVPVAFAAPTGKAAARLSQLSGEMVTTIHQRIYGQPTELAMCPDCGASPASLQVDREGLKVWCSTLNPPINPPEYLCTQCAARFPVTTRFKTKLVFSRKEIAGTDGPPPPEVVFVDEASMVDAKTAADLIADPGSLAIVYVGDHNQLPPVEGAWGPNFAQPTARLTMIHRQAAGNPILGYAGQLAGDIGRGLMNWPTDRSTAKPPRLNVSRNVAMQVCADWLAKRTEVGANGTLITWRNNDRHELNHLVRARLGLAGDGKLPIMPGDRLLSRYRGVLLNGEVVKVVSARWLDKPIGVKGDSGFQCLYEAMEVEIEHPSRPGETTQVAVVPEFLEDKDLTRYKELVTYMARELKATSERWVAKSEAGDQFRKDYGTLEAAQFARVGYDPARVLFAHYGWCLTCHASQGSQWPEVGVVLPWSFKTWAWHNDKERDWSRRWLYTAATRAEHTLTVFELAKPPKKET